MTDLPGPGASHLGSGRCRFSVWAPDAESVEVVLLGEAEGDVVRVVSLEPLPFGNHVRTVENVDPGQRYKIRVGGSDFPDPASRSQPNGVHGASEVVDLAYDWEDSEWLGVPLRDYVLYELHVGTFTLQGTFDGVAEHLEGLKELGVTALELMPVAQFPGERNWGYDGVYPYATQDSYGGVDGLRRLVDACHRSGIAVVLDVVYNHFGPEGNFAGSFGPYFTDRYNTPWDAAINFDGPGSDGVRHYFIENALWWLRDCHVDALRLDAVHAILDHSAYTFIEELGDRIAALAVETGRNIHLIAESSDNDPRLIRERGRGGYGMNAVWADDFHHSLHASAHGRAGWLLCRLRSVEATGEVLRAGVCLHRGVFALPRSAAWRVCPGRAGRALCRLCAEPRPDREPSLRRTANATRGTGGAEVGRRRMSAVSFHSVAVHGRGIRRNRPLPVLHQPLR